MEQFAGSDAADVIVAAHWNDLLGSPPAGAEVDFFAAGGTAQTASQLAARLQESSPTRLPADAVAQCRTFHEISTVLRQTGLPLRRIVPLSTGKTGVPFVLLPSGACTVVGYHRLGGDVLDRPVYGIQARGLNPQDGPPLDNLDALLDDFTAVLRDGIEERRVHLGGFCFGGLFAFELARRLLADGWEVASVVMLNPPLQQHPPAVQEVLRNRLSALAKLAASGTPLDSVEDPTAQLLVQRAAPTAEDKEVFGPRFHIFAMLWRAMIGYLPTPLDVPVRMFATPDLKGRSYWSTIGLPDLHRYDVPLEFSELPFHVPAIEQIRAQLFELEQRSRGPVPFLAG